MHRPTTRGYTPRGLGTIGVRQTALEISVTRESPLRAAAICLYYLEETGGKSEDFSQGFDALPAIRVP